MYAISANVSTLLAVDLDNAKRVGELGPCVLRRDIEGKKVPVAKWATPPTVSGCRSLNSAACATEIFRLSSSGPRLETSGGRGKVKCFAMLVTIHWPIPAAHFRVGNAGDALA